MTSNTPGSENVCNFLPLSCSYDTSEFAHLPAAAARLAHVQRSCGSGAWILVVPTHAEPGVALRPMDWSAIDVLVL